MIYDMDITVSSSSLEACDSMERLPWRGRHFWWWQQQQWQWNFEFGSISKKTPAWKSIDQQVFRFALLPLSCRCPWVLTKTWPSYLLLTLWKSKKARETQKNEWFKKDRIQGWKTIQRASDRDCWENNEAARGVGLVKGGKCCSPNLQD